MAVIVVLHQTLIPKQKATVFHGLIYDSKIGFLGCEHTHTSMMRITHICASNHLLIVFAGIQALVLGKIIQNTACIRFEPSKY